MYINFVIVTPVQPYTLGLECDILLQWSGYTETRIMYTACHKSSEITKEFTVENHISIQHQYH